MRFVYPVNQDGSKKGSQDIAGQYPIGALNSWHGGVHIEGDHGIQAIADGHIIAYKIAKECHKEQLDDTIRYSDSFVLIEHDYKSPKGQKIRFYSLYNHLQTEPEIKSDKQPSFIKSIIFVKSEEDLITLRTIKTTIKTITITSKIEVQPAPQGKTIYYCEIPINLPPPIITETSRTYKIKSITTEGKDPTVSLIDDHDKEVKLSKEEFDTFQKQLEEVKKDKDKTVNESLETIETRYGIIIGGKEIDQCNNFDFGDGTSSVAGSNLRKLPNSGIIGVIPNKTKVEIAPDEKTGEWRKKVGKLIWCRIKANVKVITKIEGSEDYKIEERTEIGWCYNYNNQFDADKEDDRLLIASIKFGEIVNLNPAPSKSDVDASASTATENKSDDNDYIPVKAGAIIGYTSNYGSKGRLLNNYIAAHIEVFILDNVDDFIENKKEDGDIQKTFALLKKDKGFKISFECDFFANSCFELIEEKEEDQYVKVKIKGIYIDVENEIGQLPTFSKEIKAYKFTETDSDKNICNNLNERLNKINDKDWIPF